MKVMLQPDGNPAELKFAKRAICQNPIVAPISELNRCDGVMASNYPPLLKPSRLINWSSQEPPELIPTLILPQRNNLNPVGVLSHVIPETFSSFCDASKCWL